MVIGEIGLVRADEFSEEKVLESIQQGNRVLLIEGYGVLVMGKSAIQVCFC